MTSHERFARLYAHQEADRVPIIDSPWEATIERWRREGMPAGVSFVDYRMSVSLEGFRHIVELAKELGRYG
jgi:hypothetical protein